MAHELIHREYIYKGKILDLSLSRFQSAEKGEVEIEVIHHTGGGGALPVFEDGTIALVRQYRYALGTYSLEIAAGRAEPGHSHEETARRELEEEVGYRARQFEKLAEFYVAPGYCQEKISVFLARDLEPSKQHLDDDEEIEVVRLTMNEALAKIATGEIEDAKTIITLLLAARRLAA